MGPSVTIKFAEGRVHVGSANLLTADIAASNGTVHVIDTVLLPPMENAGSPVKARELIELAIDRGVPMFNAGNHEGCAAVYEVTAQALVATPVSMLSNGGREKLDAALTRIKEETSARDRAWTLRHALDEVHRSLSAEAD